MDEQDTKSRSRLRWVIWPIFGVVVLAGGGWLGIGLMYEHTIKSRFRDMSATLRERIDAPESDLSLQRFEGGWEAYVGEPVPASAEFIEDLWFSVDELRNINCCEFSGVQHGYYLLTGGEPEPAESLFVLYDDGRLHMGKEAVDFLGVVPVYSADDAAGAGAK